MSTNIGKIVNIYKNCHWGFCCLQQQQQQQQKYSSEIQMIKKGNFLAIIESTVWWNLSNNATQATGILDGLDEMVCLCQNHH